MKRFAFRAGAGLLALVVAFLIVQTLASERVEVVELFTVDEKGEEVVTRLWVVDHEGTPYLRAGDGGSGWFGRLQESPEIKVARDNEILSYRAIPDPSKSAIVNQLMQKKYTWGDTFFATVFGSREGSTPIGLHPARAAGSPSRAP